MSNATSFLTKKVSFHVFAFFCQDVSYWIAAIDLEIERDGQAGTLSRSSRPSEDGP